MMVHLINQNRETNCMANNIYNKLFGIFTGAFLGYMWGWIWGWSLFDPNSDIWALAAGLCAMLGLLLGATPYFWRYANVFLTAILGLYLSWVARTLIFGDVPDGWGSVLMAAGVIASIVFGVRLNRQAKETLTPVLLGVLYAGFFGGFLIDVILLDVILGVVQSHSILSQAPAVLICGVIGGVGVNRWASTGKGKSEKEHHDTR